MVCAYRLLEHGIHASVYEACGRVGGRTKTLPRTSPARRWRVAGEHTDTEQQGYIEGAVRTGERPARELVA